ncbi:MAG: ORF6N domain-containing protein [Melioribacteraceae bacterium]|nr:ORF6N domain-containing protein [Melioribacteraceae bacterium]
MRLQKIMTKTNNNITLYQAADIQKKILTIRGEQVMLDSDLALFYGVETRVLNHAVKRNADRFPEEFMYRLTSKEWNSLRAQFGILSAEDNLISQSVISKDKRGGRQKLPYVFTEQGVAMLSAVP